MQIDDDRKLMTGVGETAQIGKSLSESNLWRSKWKASFGFCVREFLKKDMQKHDEVTQEPFTELSRWS